MLQCGHDCEGITEVEAIRYLETKSVPFIGMSARSSSRYQKHFDDLANGVYFSIMVLMMGQETVALTPLEYSSAKDLATGGFSSTVNFGSASAPLPGIVPYSLTRDEKLASNLKSAALAAFRALCTDEHVAYSRIDLRVEHSTEKIYVMKIIPVPYVFIPRENSRAEDYIIEMAFPGGHGAFFEVLLATKFATLSLYRGRNKACAARHDKNADTYDAILEETQVTTHRLGDFFGKFNYNGTVLDCCSGSGALAKFARQKGVNAEFSAVEISAGMISLPACKTLYMQPILQGAIQEVLMRAGMHDHVVCFGSFHLFTRMDFISSLCQMFLLAGKSVSFDVDDLSPTYITGSVKVTEQEHGTAWLDFNYNNVAAAVQFGIPNGWKAIVYNRRHFAYHSPLMAEDVYTHSFRFERI